ncbi:MAG: hypothetical protein GX442_22740 [Candidatus Riflebacteria bacterium]|nr:hypothetical protein [Candidatus Riflebacteria bacterium]
MNRSIFAAFVGAILACAVCFGQDFSSYRAPQTLQGQPATSFSLGLPEGRDPLSPYYVPAAQVFDLDKGNEELFAKEMVPITKSLGFWMGQAETLKAILKQFPDLFSQCLAARDAFQRNVGPAILQVLYILDRATKGKMNAAALQSSFFGELKKLVKAKPEHRAKLPWLFGDRISRGQAEGFIKLVEARSRFEADLEALRPLLLFHPRALADPMGLASGDFLKRFDFDTHPKAKGLTGWVRYPAHWEVKEGNGPNIVARFLSPRDGAMFFLMVKSLPQDIPEGESLGPLLSDEETIRGMAQGQEVISKRIVQVAGQEALELRTKGTQNTPVARIFQEQIIYMIFYRKWMMSLFEGVSALSEEDCSAAMGRNLQAFQYLATMCGIKRIP